MRTHAENHGSSYIVFLEETKITNYTNPDEHCCCSQQDTADIVVCQVLQKERKHNLMKNKLIFKDPAP